MPSNDKPKKAKTAALPPVKRHDKQFFSDIASLLAAARAVAYRAVNAVMVGTYWQIGRRIVEQEQNGKDRADYGDFLIVNLSRYLTDTFGKGFSEANLWNFKRCAVGPDASAEESYPVARSPDLWLDEQRCAAETKETGGL